LALLFKVVLTSVDEPKGTADFALYLRACGHFPFIGKSCTPYFIGGIPWFPTSEKKGLLLSLQPVNQTLMFHNSTESELLKLKRKPRARIA
jgi:hypothetical protein